MQTAVPNSRGSRTQPLDIQMAPDAWEELAVALDRVDYSIVDEILARATIWDAV